MYPWLLLQLDYFETLFKPFSSESLEEIMAQLRDMLVARAMQTIEAQEEVAASVRAARPGGDAEPQEFVPRTQQELRVSAAVCTSIIAYRITYNITYVITHSFTYISRSRTQTICVLMSWYPFVV